MAYTTRGEGERIVLFVHGVLSTGRSLAPLARRLSSADAGIRAVLPDLPGHGATPVDETAPTIAAVAEVLLKLAGALTDRAVDVVGHSMGGRLALQMAIAAPERIGRIVLLDAPVGPLDHRPSPLEPVVDAMLAAPDTAPSREAMRTNLADAGLEAGQVKWLLGHVVDEEGGVRWTVDRPFVAALRQSVMYADLYDGAATVPVYALRGASSPFVKAEDVEGCRARGIEVIDIPNAGHDLHIAAPRLVLSHIVRCFERGRSSGKLSPE